MWPTQFLPRVIVNARRRYEAMLEARAPDAEIRTDLAKLLVDSPARDEAVKVMEEYLDATIGDL
jgi:hypothetical protein